MSVLEEITKYANDCIDGEIVSCQKHIWACKRFLRDLERMRNEADYPFEWDDDAAGAIVDWFALLRHSKGVLAGQPIELTPWQKFRHCQLYGWRMRETGKRRFLKTFTEVARKNAKSQDEAGIALYEISVGAVKNGEVYEYYTAGVKRDQSKIVFEEAKLMLKDSPLRVKFKIVRDRITHIKTGSFIRPLSKEDGRKGDGTNPAGLIIDEYHQHPTTEFYDLSMGSNTKEPLTMIITTAGVDLTYPCYKQEYKHCSDILNPDIDVEDERYFADICELDREDYEDISQLEDRKTWYKANPIRMTYQQGRDLLEQAYSEAVAMPEKMTAFLTKCMDIWVQARHNGYMDMAKWKACEVEDFPDLRGMPVYWGVDASSKIDLMSVAAIIPIQTEWIDSNGKRTVRYYLETHSFIPSREKLQERKLIDKFDYDMCERMGLLSVTETPIVDQSAVMQYMLNRTKEMEWEVQCFCFDPANAAKFMMDLSDEGYIVEEVWQSHKSLNEATQGFREQVYCGNVAYKHNPLLNFAMSNAVTRTYNGLIKIDKDATTKRIDPVDATLCAFKLAIFHTFDNPMLESIDRFLNETW